ncbi:hypothetical protein JCGZ_03507 [Jatropha curcas]|uniref:RING-type E3 ubiquitin transferase n=1 Tax=Jatropha curcas TaxID=180498 RepID=A0A067KUT2_JATCU|nr:RING-H2 finger protein ATL74 [Jatropha curcas]KDP39976.1 hypothetical protein JCGZ_03507 [Jatropha curcas]
MEKSVYHRHQHRLFLDKEIGMAPNNHGDKTSSNYYASKSTNFDNNMVIILAALLCALIFALGLNSIVRCAVRCGYRFVSETTPTATAEATGLKKSTLKQIPVVAYESELNTPVTECPICLGEFEQGEKVKILPKCNHGFHVKCVDKWLLLHSSCPLCRQPLLDQV